jgi:multidrug efflux system outer membrane protein
MRNRNKQWFWVGLLLWIALHGCTVGPEYHRPNLPEVATYQQEFEKGASIANLPWWELFQDSVLQELIREALKSNRSLRATLARVEEARANLGIVRASLFPMVNYGGEGKLEQTLKSGETLSSSATLGLDVSYQVDWWGRIHRANEAALQQLLATEEAYRNAVITLVADVAGAYLVLRDIDNRLLISQYTVEARRRSLEAMEARHRAGLISEVDLNQSRIQLADAEAAVKNFERLRSQTENAINLLLGRPPQAIPRGRALKEQIFPPAVPVGLPSELLERRPDILEAERKLHAQTARIGVAEALKYPQLNLSANMGASLGNLNAAFASLAAQIFGPLYHAGEYQRRVDVEIARARQLLNLYQQTYFNALREVEDALVAVRTYREEYAIRDRQVQAARAAAELAWVRYEGGMTSYLEVLDLQRSLFTAELKASEALEKHLSAIIQLYKALGGGWVAEGKQ